MLSFFCFAGVSRPKDQLGMHGAELVLHFEHMDAYLDWWFLGG